MDTLPSLVLEFPISIQKHTSDGVKNETITEIKLTRRPIAKDFLRMKVNSQEIGEFMEVFANCAGLSMATIEKLDGKDMFKAQEIVSGFLA